MIKSMAERGDEDGTRRTEVAETRPKSYRRMRPQPISNVSLGKKEE